MFKLVLERAEEPEIKFPTSTGSRKKQEKEVYEDDFDVDAALKKETKSKIGDIYKLGRHRLMCGDSTKESDVDKLVNMKEIDLLLTDPPYNVDYTGKTDDELKIENDNMNSEVFLEFLSKVFDNAYNAMENGAAFYVWYASREVVNFQTAITNSGLTVKQELVWNKNSMVMGRSDYQWKHEPCLYGWKTTGSHTWYGDRKQVTVIDWDRPARNNLHPTMKPVGLFDYQIKNSTKRGDVVLDLFGGSGTSIIACEQNGRKCYTMEYDPRYVDVIIERWENLTGKKARLIKENKEYV